MQLTARAADGIVQQLVDAGGRISASAAGAAGGTIVLDGVGGDITVSRPAGRHRHAGRPDRGAAERHRARSRATARLDASGAPGGGVVAVGTTLARASGGPAAAGAARSAAAVCMPARASPRTRRASGDGGHVAVLSSGQTVMNGAISARGGAHGGNGGTVEVSGNVLGFDGTIDVERAGGRAGQRAVRPGDAGHQHRSTCGPSSSASVTPSFGLDGSRHRQRLGHRAGGRQFRNVTLQASPRWRCRSRSRFQHNVNVTLQSGGDLTVDANKGLTLNSGATLILQAGYNFANSKVEVGTGSLMVDGATLSAGAMTLQAAGGIGLGSAHIGAGSLLDIGTAGTIAGAGGDVTQAAGGVLNAGTLQSSGGVTGTVSLAGTKNAIGTLGTFAVTGGDLSVVDTGAMTVNAPVTATNVTLSPPTPGLRRLACHRRRRTASSGTLALGSTGDRQRGRRRQRQGRHAGLRTAASAATSRWARATRSARSAASSSAAAFDHRRADRRPDRRGRGVGRHHRPHQQHQSLQLHVTNGATIDLPTGGSLFGGNITLTAGAVTGSSGVVQTNTLSQGVVLRRVPRCWTARTT